MAFFFSFHHLRFMNESSVGRRGLSPFYCLLRSANLMGGRINGDRIKWASIKTKLLAIFLSLTLSGCVMIPPRLFSKLTLPQFEETKRRAWVAPVKITDTASWKNPSQRNQMSKSLTLEIVEFIDTSDHFSGISVFPSSGANLKADDFILCFEFRKLKNERIPSALGTIASIVTVTLYMFFNGPIESVEWDYSAELIIKDIDGKILGASNATFQKKRWVGLYQGLEVRAPDQRDMPFNEFLGRLIDQGLKEVERYEK